MIDIRFQRDRGVVELRPHPPLTCEDFQQAAAVVDPELAKHGHLKGLLILADEFPGWKDLSALRAHVDFVSERHRRISRVAAVSDSPIFKVLPAVARRFVAPEVRHFPAGEREAAERWLEEAAAEPPEAGAIRYLRFRSRLLMWIEVDGRVTRREYGRLEEAMKTQIAEENRVSYLVRLRKLEGLEAGALWEDLRFGLTNLGHIERVAVVADERWAAWLSRLSGLLMPGRVRHFSPEEEDQAWHWLGAENPAMA